MTSGSSNDSPFISVIMSIFNEPEEWLRESIESILNQSFKDFEFIIIDDNPNSNLNYELLTKYQSADNRIIIIKNDVNIGLTKSLNIGLKKARGKYIARMDADDISLPKRFEKQVDYLEKNPVVIVCGTNISYFGNVVKRKIRWIKSTDEDLKYQLFSVSCFAHPTVLIRKEVLDKYQISYDEEFPQAQDFRLWSQLRNLGDFYALPDVLLYYRISNIQIGKKHKARQIDLSNRIRKDIIENTLAKEFPQIHYQFPSEYSTESFNEVITLWKKFKDRTFIEVLNSYVLNLNYTSIQVLLLLILKLTIINPYFNRYNYLRLIKRSLR